MRYIYYTYILNDKAYAHEILIDYNFHGTLKKKMSQPQ